MINRHLASLVRQMKIHVCLHQIGCLCYCCYAKTSSSAVQKRHSKVYGNHVFPSFYSILLGLCQGCYCKESYFRSVHIFVLQCTVSGRNVNTRRMSKPDMGSIFHIKKSMKYSGHRKLLCELSKLSKFNAFNLLGY